MKKLFLHMVILTSTFSYGKVELLDRVAIIVDEGVVMESQITDAITSTKIRYREQNLEIPPDQILIEDIKEALIIEELQLQVGKDAGVRISDGELNVTFIQIAQNNGLGLEEFIEGYEASGQSYEKLREEVRNDMIIQRVQNGLVSNSINITDQEIKGFLSTEEAISQLTPEILLRQIQVSKRSEADLVQLKIDEGEDFNSLVEIFSINPNKANDGLLPWRKINEMPSAFAESIKDKPLNFVSELIETGSGFHFLKVEEKRGPLVKFEKQWETRHILLSPSAIRDYETTRYQIQNLRDRIISGEDFALIAEQYSEDPGSGSSGGNLGWLPMGATVSEFETVMINSNINEISEIFESEFGFHFLEVINIRTEDITDKEIENRAYSILFSRKFDEELENTLRSMRAEAFVEFKDLD